MFYILTKLFVGGSKMVALYVALIVNDRRTFEQVPAKLKAAVQTLRLSASTRTGTLL